MNARAHAVRTHLIESSSRRRILTELEYAISPWRRFAGLMGRRALPEGFGLYFPHCSSIHTCFMRFTIDIIYIDSGWKVMKTVQRMKPWRLSFCPGASGVIETAAGCIAANGIVTGTELQPVENGEIRE